MRSATVFVVAMLVCAPVLADDAATSLRRIDGGLARVDAFTKLDLAKMSPRDLDAAADAVLDGFPWREKYDDSRDQRDLFALREKLVAAKRPAVAAIPARMARHTHPYVRMHAVAALGELGEKSYAVLVAERLDDTDPRVRGAAVEALASIGARDHAAALEKRLADDSEEVRIAALRAIARVSGRSAGAAIARRLDDPSARVRGWAAWALDEAAATDQVASLRAALARDGRAQLRSAERSLGATRGERRQVAGRSIAAGDRSRGERVFLRVSTPEEWKQAWERSGREGEPPAIDFRVEEVVAVFGGGDVNTRGFSLEEAFEDDGEVRVRVVQQSFQTCGPDGGAVAARPFGLFALPRTSKAIVVEEDVHGLIGDAPVYEVRATLDGASASQ